MSVKEKEKRQVKLNGAPSQSDVRIIQFTDCYWQNSTGWVFLGMQIVLKLFQARRSRNNDVFFLKWNIAWKMCFSIRFLRWIVMARMNDSSLSRNYTIAACCGTGLATQTTLAFYLKGSGSLHLRPQWWVSCGFHLPLRWLKIWEMLRLIFQLRSW